MRPFDFLTSTSSISLNPNGKHYQKLKEWQNKNYTDNYFDDDAVVMEFNSRDFVLRSNTVNANAEACCDYLRSATKVISEVYYPKWQAPANYQACLRKTPPAEGPAPVPGYAGLFSVLFTTVAAAQAFYDTLQCAKGPSLGTNFTLACPYAIIAHYYELDWAKDHGVPLQFVRISVGLEDRTWLLDMLKKCVEAAEKAEAEYAPGDIPGATWSRIVPEPPTPVAYAASSAGWE